MYIYSIYVVYIIYNRYIYIYKFIYMSLHIYIPERDHLYSNIIIRFSE